MVRQQHYCELEKEPDTIFPMTLPNVSVWSRMKRQLQKFFLLSKSNPRTKSFLRSSAAITLEMKRHARSEQWYIIHPFSKLRVIWETMMIVVLFVNLLEIPFIQAFVEIENPDRFMVTLSLMCDLICCSDVLINFFTGYHERETKEIVMNHRRIARNYLKGYFFIDLISSLPLDYIVMEHADVFFTAEDYYNFGLVAVDSVSCLKIFRIKSLLKYTTRFAEQFEVKYAVIRILRLTIISMMFFHWWACIHFFFPRFIHGHAIYIDDLSTSSSWIVQTNIGNTSIVLQYANSLLRSVSNTVTLGYGHDYPKTWDDMLIVTLNIITGAMLYAYCIVVLLHVLTSMNASETKYQEIMTQLQEYMSHKRLTRHVQHRLLAYYDYRFQKRYFRESAIIASLSNHLREEILLHCCQRLVENVVIFRNLPKIVVNLIVKSLKHDVFLMNDVVVKAGMPGDCMYFIASGTVAVFTPMGKEVCHLEDNSHFGEVALIMDDDHRTASVVAVEICETYRLDRSDFLRIFTPFPDLMAKIEEIAVDRVMKTLLIEEEHKRLLLKDALNPPVKKGTSLSLPVL